MPYIAKDLRPAEGQLWPEYRDPGGLNYRLTMLVRGLRHSFTPQSRIVTLILTEVNAYLDRPLPRAELTERVGYAKFNEVLGVLDAARREHKRRGWWQGEDGDSVFALAADVLYMARVAPYEELKIAENGDITDRG